MNDFYTKLPEPPETISSTTILVRMIDALGFRYKWALEGLTDNDLDFRPVESSMNIREVLQHIHYLVSRLHLCFTGNEKRTEVPKELGIIKTETLEMIVSIREKLLGMNEKQLSECHIVRQNTGEKFSFWYFINGPLADALTHIGQITTWRRISGKPVMKSNPFLGLPPEGY